MVLGIEKKTDGPIRAGTELSPGLTGRA